MVESMESIAHRIQEGKPSRYRKPIHVMLSPPLSEWSRFIEKGEFPRLRRKVTRLAKKRV